MKIRMIFLVFICIFLISCNLPFTINWNTPTPSTQPTDTQVVELTEVATIIATAEPTEPSIETANAPAFEGNEFNLGGVYMVLPPCLAASASGILIDAVPYDEMNGPMEYYPENRKISFEGYPLSDKFFDPTLTVYPAPAFAAMSDATAERINSLQILLAAKPANPDTIPFLPIFNAAQVFRTKVAYLPFQNGEGVRFLTEYAQYYAPVNNTDLFYGFQGLTSDGKYLVSIILPVNAAYLQAAWDSTSVPSGGIVAPSFDDPNLDAAMDAYYASMLDLLNNTPDAEFTPSLECLDQFIQSLQIND